MPRQARLDAPGALQHVMARGIEGTNIFRTDKDRNDFLDRLAAQCKAEALKVYAWAFIPNHFHLLVRTGNRPIFASMRKILTGYVVRFKRYFGKGRRVAVKRYIVFIEEGVSQGKRPELVGGGLLRSVGGGSEVVSMRRRGMGMVSELLNICRSALNQVSILNFHI